MENSNEMIPEEYCEDVHEECIKWTNNIGAQLINSCTVELNGILQAHYINVEGKLMTCLGCSKCVPGMSDEHYDLSKELSQNNKNGYIEHAHTMEDKANEDNEEREQKRKFSQTFTKKLKHKFKSPKNQ